MTKAKPNLQGKPAGSKMVNAVWPIEGEIWKPIPGLEFYEASSLGNIRSLDRIVPFMTKWGSEAPRLHRGRILRLKPKPNGCGGIYWSFYAGIEDGYWQVNRAVCAAFNGMPPSQKHEAAHLDGDTNHNRPENLIWATPVENAAHKIRHGTNQSGEKNAMSRFTEADIVDIFRAYCEHGSAKEIAESYGVTSASITRIVSSRGWRHVEVGSLRETARKTARANLERSWETAKRRMEQRDHSLRMPVAQN